MGHSTVMLSAAKHLAAQRDRPFAALRVTVWIESGGLHGAKAGDRPFASLRVTVEGPISSSVLFFETA